MAKNFTKFFIDPTTGRVESIAASKINVVDARAGALRVGGATLPGTDTNFYASGSADGKLSSEFGVGVFGGDLVISGALYGENDGVLKVRTPLLGYQGLSGSLQTLTDGLSYLVANGNITITSASNGQILISASGGDTLTKEVLSKDTNGSTTDFSLSGTPSSAAKLQVYVNGMLRLSGSSSDYVYDETNNQVDFTSPPASGSIVQAIYTSGGGSGGGGSGLWLENAGNLYPLTLTNKVGVGTASPEGKLEVVASVDPNSDLNDGDDYQLVLKNSQDVINQSVGIGFQVSTAASNLGAAIIHNRDGSNSQGDLKFYTKNSTSTGDDPELALTITNEQRVGIGNSSPSAKLEIKTTDSDNISAVLIDADELGAVALDVDSDSTFYPAIRSKGIAAAYLEQDIGGGYGLYVYRNMAEAGSNPLVRLQDDNTNNTQTTLEVRQDGTGDIVNFLTGSDEVVTVDATGQMGVGTTTPNEKVTVEGAISLDELSAAPGVTSGYGKIYVKSSDSKLYFKDDSGTEFDLTAAASAGAPTNAEYVVLTANGTLTDERVITAGDGISLTDAGAGSTLTISSSVNTSDFAYAGGVLNLGAEVVKSASADTGTADGASHTLTFAGGEGIDTSAAGSTITIAGEDSSYTNKGVSSFAVSDFTVASGHVALDDNVIKQVETDSGNALGAGHAISIVGGPNVTVQGSGDTVTISATGGGATFHKELLTQESSHGAKRYVLQNTPEDGKQVQIYVNGVLFLSGAGYDYTYNLPNNRIDFNSSPPSGSVIQAIYTVGTAAGSSGNPQFFFSTTNASIFTTGATAFVGGQSSPAAPDAPSDIGTDVFFFVSGTIGSHGTTNTGSAVFGGDVVISGSLFGGSPLIIGDSLRVTGSVDASLGLSGSLTRLPDGTSYLVAGSNVTITSQSNGQVTIASSGGGGGSITVRENDGDPSVSDVTTISFDNAIVTDAGSNTVVISGTIGTAEDGTYEDGLFTSFTNKTYTGVAIDKINEVLKLLAPSPAPDLDDANSFQTGTPVYLSFGSSNSVSEYTNVGNSAGLGAAVDVNGLYTVATSSNNIRLGAFNHTQSISGDLNADVSTGFSGGTVLNFVSQSFGNAEQGYLHLEVNGAVIMTASLSGTTGATTVGINPPGSGSGTYLNRSGSGFTNLSVTGSSVNNDGSDFTFFQHRTGRYVVAPDSQRNGWNYARVLHYTDGAVTQTNYIEWVNDSNSDALAASSNTATAEMSGSVHLSGVEYFLSGNMRYKVAVSNAYRNVYDNNNITFTTSRAVIGDQSKPTIDTAGGETHTKVLHLTGVGPITQNNMTVGAVTASVNVTHPLKANLTNAGTTSVSGILLYSLSGSSSGKREFFQSENFRIQSGAFNTQADVTSAGNSWDSTKHMTASNGGHTNGLQFFSSSLRSPLNTVYSGDFRNTTDGGSIANGPSENPNYSGQSGQRTFYRYFQNNTGATQYTAKIAISGSSTTIVDSSTGLDTGKMRVFLKIPTGSAGATGWLDLATAFSLGSYEDNDGCFDVSFDSSLNASNFANFGNQGIANSEYLCMRVEADTSWTGQVDYIELEFGAGTGTTTAAPNLSQVDADVVGVTSKLSFGSSKAVTGYENVAASAGIGSAVDVNGTYQVATSSNNYRAGTFNGSSAFSGDLNPQVTNNSPSYVGKSFGDAKTGSLSLEVNGSAVHTIQLTGTIGTGNPGSGTGTDVNSNGSGFTSLSTHAAAEFSNGVKDYNKLYRTSKYAVAAADQRNGWNYARVIHTVDGTARNSTYTEWVNDNDSNALTITNISIGDFGVGASEPYYQSGIGYFVNCTSSIKYQSDNAYQNVYSALSSAVTTPAETNLTINEIVISGSGVTDQDDSGDDSTLASLLTGVSNSQTLPIFVTHSVAFSQSESLPGPYGSSALSVTGTVRVKHPLKSNVTSSEVAKGVFLVFTSSNTSDVNNNEYFTSEKFRIQSGTYSSQASVILKSSKWSPSSSMNNASLLGHYAGALVYNDQMISPLSGVLGGDYRGALDGGLIQAPLNNPNYSSLAIKHREYERYFRNNTSSDTPQITITLYGDATLVARAGANSGSLGRDKNIHCDVKIPGKTGYLDLARASDGPGNINDGDGGLSGDLDPTIDTGGASNICTFNGETLNGTASSPENVIVRIVSDRQFTGKISRIQIAYS